MATQRHKIYLIAALYALLPTAALAADRRSVAVEIVHVGGENALTTQEAFEIYGRAKRSIRRGLGVRLELRRFTHFAESPISEIFGLELGARAHEIGAWREQLKRQRGARVLSIVLLPPIKIGSVYWLAGAASSVCDRSGIAVAHVEMRSAEGDDRQYQSEIVIAHELAHLLGASASHEAGTVMDADAIALSKTMTLGFGLRAKKQARGCLS